jgi:hypothetical protein
MSINLQIFEFQVPDSDLDESGLGIEKFAVPIFSPRQFTSLYNEIPYRS